MPLSNHRPLRDPMSCPSAPLVLAQARLLQRDARAGRTQPLLRGRHFALVCDSDIGADAQLFRRAATELGAAVAHVRPVLSERSPAQDVQHSVSGRHASPASHHGAEVCGPGHPVRSREHRGDY